MPAAIETTKRKFHRLLEGLTTSSSDAGSPTSKRPKLTPTSRLSTLPPRRVVLPPSIPNEPLAPSPWSHAAFLERLRTFSSITHWSTKPQAINEVAWAARGWTCSHATGDYNTVVCHGGCEARRVVSLRPSLKGSDDQDIPGTEDLSIEPDDDLVERYVTLIEEAHGEDCIWRGEGNACKKDVYRLMFARPTVWQSQLRERYKSLVGIADRLPQLDDLKHPADLDQVIGLLPEGFFDTSTAPATDESTPSEEPSSSINRAALAFALLGWKGVLDFPSSPYAVATCDACFRRLGLWLYTTPSDPMPLDLQQNHRDYCPWISPESQSMTGGLAGKAAWEVLQTLIRNNAGFVPSRPTTAAGPDDSHAHVGEDGVAQDAVGEKSREEIEEEDRKRFAKLRELSRSMGLKRWRRKAETKTGKT